MVRSAYTLRPEDDDFTQPGILVRKVFNDAQRNALVDTVAGSLLGGVREPVLGRAFDYWRSIDAKLAVESKRRCAPVRPQSPPKAWASAERFSHEAVGEVPTWGKR